LNVLWKELTVVRYRLALLTGIVLLAGVGVRANPTTETGVTRMSQAEFKQALEAKSILVLDVRGDLAYGAGHIPGAVVWDNDPARFDKQLAEIKSAKKTVVTYCTCPAEHSAAGVALILLQHGVDDARALKGGLNEWRDGGNRVVTGGKPE
jgi:rhodanese-related sulfurtransferase